MTKLETELLAALRDAVKCLEACTEALHILAKHRMSHEHCVEPMCREARAAIAKAAEIEAAIGHPLK
jgi:hypothetical protein